MINSLASDSVSLAFRLMFLTRLLTSFSLCCLSCFVEVGGNDGVDDDDVDGEDDDGVSMRLSGTVWVQYWVDRDWDKWGINYEL